MDSNINRHGRSGRFIRLSLPLILILLFTWTANAQVVYVDQSATGTGDGASWANAVTDLQSAIDLAATVATGANPIQIWVKADTYYPTSGSDRTVAFEIKNAVELYGGFDGTEVILGERDFEKNSTILSGDIGISSDNSDNSYGVIFAGNTVTDYALIDGFHVTGASSINDAGGAVTYGAVAIVDSANHLEVNHCDIYENECLFGSAIFHYASTNPAATMDIYNSKFHDNGGGSLTNAIWANKDLTVINCLFYNNSGGAAIYRQLG